MDEKRILTDQERLNWLKLSRTSQIGPITFNQLIQKFKSPTSALDYISAHSNEPKYKNFVIPSSGIIEKEIEQLNKIGGRFIAQIEPDYPYLLSTILDAPPLISVLGNISLYQKPTISIVGSRNASSNGRKIAENIASELSQGGYTIISGLARGIDTAAHEGSLAYGTIAVVAGGLNSFYPLENQQLQKSIGQQGLLISETPLGLQPQARHFPRRNRLISGLSLGILIVEATFQSGSLTTARFGLEQGREIMAIPGSPLDPRCHGTNNLIKNGAQLVENAQDILTYLQSIAFSLYNNQSNFLPTIPKKEDKIDNKDFNLNTGRHLNDSHNKHIETLLSTTPISIDDLHHQSQLSIDVLNMVLSEMELAGKIERHPGNRISKVFNLKDNKLIYQYTKETL
ncbi:MAG: DNA-processing protein DprA [Alphaproteobacteria bacterium]|nr:DNA-processing protein DprA [Alphaproteobacteria bacterium]